MKRIIVLLTIMGAISMVSNAQAPVVSTAKLESVRVYRQGAELQSQASFSVSAGEVEIVVGNVADAVREQSIQASVVSGGLQIQSVQYTPDYYREYVRRQEHAKLGSYKARIEETEREIEAVQIEIEAQKKTIGLLDDNQQLLVGKGNAGVAQLTELVEYYTTKRVAVSKRVQELQRKLEALNAQLAECKKDLEAAGQKIMADQGGGAVIIKGRSSTAGRVVVDLRYIATQAQWSPLYELAGENVHSPLGLTFKAQVYQQTGLAWKGVHLSFINGMPGEHNVAPTLSPWFLQAMKTRQYRSGRGNMSMPPQEMMALASNVAYDKAEEEQQFKVESHQLNTSYEISTPFDIQSDGQEHLIELYRQELAAEYAYITVPNSALEAYLVARVKDYNKYGLVGAPAVVLFEQMYVGETYLNPNETGDALTVTLGNDRRIAIVRENVNDKSGSSILSTSQERTITYDLVIRNNKKEAVEIEVQDRYPLSTNEDIKVTLLEHSGAKVNEEKGYLRWNLTVGSGESQRLRVSYKVRYPKSMELENL